MIEFIPKTPTEAPTFKDVQWHQFFVTKSGALFQKASDISAHRIAIASGCPSAIILHLQPDDEIARIVEIEKIKF